MTDILNTAIYWLHTIASHYWLGGIAFILLIQIPKTKQVLGNEAGKLIGITSKTFKKHVDICIIIIIITGIAMSITKMPSTILKSDYNSWEIVLIIKHFIVALMILIHIFRNTILSKRINRQTEISKRNSLQKLSLNLVKIVLVFGLIVLLLSTIASKF